MWYVGGTFTGAGSLNVSNIAKYDGSSWMSVGSGSGKCGLGSN